MRLSRSLVLLLVLAGCDNMRQEGGGNTTSAPTTKPESGGKPPGTGTDEILIGEYGSFTGPEATFGQSTHNGIMLAVTEWNAKGGVKGKKIRVQDYDTKGTTQEAGTAVMRLVTSDKVVALLGEVASGLSKVGGGIAQKYGVPMITPSSTNDRVTDIGDMVFRVCFTDSFQGWAMAKFARDNLKLTRVAVLYEQSSPYSKDLSESFAKAFKEMGGQVVSNQAYNKGDNDFSAQLGTIRDSKPEGIYVPGYYTDVGNISLQVEKLGIKVPLLGGDGWDSDKLGEIAGKSIEGGYYSNHYSPEEKRPEIADFVERYKKAYGGQIPDGLAALGYDAAKLLFESMERAPSMGGKDLAAAISATKDFHGVTGVYSIDEKRNAKKPAVIVQMKGGKPTYVATVNPQ
jgi:branched-chain amino acid transport system substrate-binding protein